MLAFSLITMTASLPYWNKQEKQDRYIFNKSLRLLCQSQYIFRSASSAVTMTFLKGYMTSKYITVGGEASGQLGDLLSHTIGYQPP
jgi:hypothetical protein